VSLLRASSSSSSQPESLTGASERSRWFIDRSFEAADLERAGWILIGFRRAFLVHLRLGLLAVLDNVAWLKEDASRDLAPVGRSPEQELEVHAEMLELLSLGVAHDRDSLRIVLDREALLVPADRLGLLGQRGAKAGERARRGGELVGWLVVLVESHRNLLRSTGRARSAAASAPVRRSRRRRREQRRVFGRLTRFGGVAGDGKLELYLGLVRDRVLPVVRKLPGFSGYLALTDDAGEVLVVTLWAGEQRCGGAKRRRCSCEARLPKKSERRCCRSSGSESRSASSRPTAGETGRTRPAVGRPSGAARIGRRAGKSTVSRCRGHLRLFQHFSDTPRVRRTWHMYALIWSAPSN
jgi:hypothetical protein